MGHCLSVYTDDKPTSNESLTNTSISQIGSTVRVECHEDDSDEKNTSYVLVYRAYGNSTLSVTTYNKTISVNTTLESGNYTFAIFRRNDSDIDEKPLITQLIVVDQTGTDPPLSSSSSSPSFTGNY